MTTEKFIKQMTTAGITASSDGLLRDLLYRGKWSAALSIVPEAIQKRKKEIEFLNNLMLDIKEEQKKGEAK